MSNKKHWFYDASKEFKEKYCNSLTGKKYSQYCPLEEPSSPIFSDDEKVKKVDEVYKFQNESEYRKDVKEYIGKAFKRAFRFFPEKDMPSKLQADFGGTTWAIYLTDLFLQKGYKLIPPKESEGPDITLEYKGKTVYIELINVNNNPDSKYAVTPVPYGRVYSPDGREPEMYMKIKEAIKVKMEQRNRWIKNGKIKKEGVFLVAINASDLSPGDGHSEFPVGYKSLYPVGEPAIQLTFNPKTMESVGDPKKVIPWNYNIKIKERDFNKDGFVSQSLKEVSGIIYSGVHIVNSFHTPGDDICFINNSRAINPLDKHFLSFGKTFYTEITKDFPDLTLKLDYWKGKKK